ncbi:aldehyde ferredoxin oxidoreductase family protein [Chloroflexota bacterium]
MAQLYGYMGKMLRVDLGSERITEESFDEATARQFIGGTGIGIKYLYDEVPAGVEWSDEDNRMIFATGPLGGTKIAGSGGFSVIAKSPLTNGAGAGQANGYFGAYLKFAGYDSIIIQGKAKKWAYLYIHEDGVELRDAAHLRDKDTWDTSDLIKGELGQTERGMSVTCIGPAGENLVKYAAIVADKAHVIAHGGLGAVMGSKQLKAIAVARTKGRPVLKDEKRLSDIARQFHYKITHGPQAKRQFRESVYRWGTLFALSRYVDTNAGILPVKNYTTSVYDIAPEDLDRYRAPYIRSHFKAQRNPCWSCSMNHCHWLTITEGPYKGRVVDEPEYETLAAFGPLIGVTDVAATIYLAHLTDSLGFDSCETGWVLALVMECYEKGHITSEDTDGLEMTWGNYEAAGQMIQRIARREGFGDILAEGAMSAARHIGGEAPNFAIGTIKGNTPPTHDHRARWPMLFSTCFSQIGVDEGYSMLDPADLGMSVKPSRRFNTSPEDTVAWNTQCKGADHFEDSLMTCRYTTRADLKLEAEALSAATGWDFPAEETMQVGRRIVHLLRAFNVRHGHTAEMDAPSPRYGSIPVDGPAQGTNIMAHWEDMRRQYYELMGWDTETGKPLPDTLKSYDLEYAIPELWGNSD